MQLKDFMAEQWEYVCGELRDRSSIRVYRKGPIGKVNRHRGGKCKTRYFVWSLPDSSPEYETEAEALAAIEGEGE